jgi:hypothetical protein
MVLGAGGLEDNAPKNKCNLLHLDGEGRHVGLDAVISGHPTKEVVNDWESRRPRRYIASNLRHDLE